MQNYERERRYEYDINPTLNQEPFHRYSTGHHRKQPFLSSTPHRRDSRSMQYMEAKRTDSILNDRSFADQQDHLIPKMNESYQDRTASVSEYKKREKKPYQLEFNHLMQEEKQRGVKKVFFGKEEDYQRANPPIDFQKKAFDRLTVQKPHGGIIHNRGFQGDSDWRKKGNQKGDHKGDQKVQTTAQKQNKLSGSNLRKGKEWMGQSKEINERDVVQKIGRISRLNEQISTRLQRLLEKVG